MFKSIILTVSVLWTPSLADFCLSCHPLTPTCPGTVANCQCDGAAASLTWNVSSGGSSCIIEYYDARNTLSPDIMYGNCNSVTTDVSTDIMDPNLLYLYNSNLSINLKESVIVSCRDGISNQMRHPLQLTSMTVPMYT